MKKRKKLITKIIKRTLLATGLVGVLGVGLVVFASVDWIDDSKLGSSVVSSTPSPTQASTPTTTQVQYKPTTIKTSQGLSLEDRQRLGKERGDLEEIIRKGDESKQKLASSLNVLLNQCQKASTYDKQCWDDYYKSQDEVNHMVKTIDSNNAKARSRISEINALLGS